MDRGVVIRCGLIRALYNRTSVLITPGKSSQNLVPSKKVPLPNHPINQIITMRFFFFAVEGVDKDKLTDEWIDVVKSKQDIQNHQSRLMLK